MNSTPSAPSGKGMMIIIFVVVLVLLGVGGYFVYQKFFSSSSQCANKGSDKSSNVSTFVWDSKSSSCVANVCMDGYGDAATGGAPISGKCSVYTAPAPAPASRIYYPIANGNCSSNGTTALTPLSTTTTTQVSDMDCQQSCNSTTSCLGYDWTVNICNLYDTTPTKTVPGAQGTTCSALKV